MVVLYFVVMDLEWNNAYNKVLKAFFNEIIEIGAVMIDENMEVTDTFSALIRSQLSKKLSGRVRDLTHITNEDMYGGISFDRAISDFTKWIGDKDCVFMSWGNTDIHVLLENLNCFCGTDSIPFIKSYADAQRYCQNRLKLGNAKQIGLSAAAAMFDIDVSEYSTHRALDDSLLTCRCLKKAYSAEDIGNYISVCDDEFYKRLKFKAHNITDIHSEKIDRSLMVCPCSECSNYMKRITKWRIVNQSFRATFYCRNCRRKSMFTIRYREYFDHIDIKTKVIDLDDSEKEQTEKVNQPES